MSLVWLPTNYALHRAETGRLSSGLDTSDVDKGRRRKVVQVQNIPKKLRDSIVPEPGCVFVGADWAAIEWSLVMYFAAKLNDPVGFHLDLLDRFQAGQLDPHRYLANIAFKKPEALITGAERSRCKPYTYGRLYFGSPRTLARNARHSDAIGIEVCAAHEIAFNPKAWWEAELASATTLHYVETPLGWRRWFWEWKPKPTEVYATKIQATAADLMKWVLKRMFAEAPDLGFKIITTTHDSVLVQAQAAAAAAAAAWVKGHMEAPIPWLGNRTWRAEVKVGPNWRAVS